MLEYIKNTDIILMNILNKFDDYFLKISENLKFNFNEIIFIASGSSYNAASIASNYIEQKLNIKVNIYFSNFFVESYNKRLLDNEKLYILISQTGNTKVVKDALDILNKMEFKYFSLTAYDDSIIAKESKNHINIGCGDEKYLFRTIGVSSTILICYILAISILKMKNKYDYLNEIELLKKSILNMKNSLNNGVEWYNNNKCFLQNKKMVFFVGANELYNISKEADIKFMEMVPILSKHYEIEEFIHGPQNCFSDDIAYFILHNKLYSSIKTLNILEYLNNKYNSVVCISNGDLNYNHINIDIENNYFDIFNYLIVFQVLAYYFAIGNNRDLTKRINSDIDNYVKKSLK